MNKLSVSICVPAYNEGKNISHLLESLLAQKTKFIEIKSIVVISSNSTDETDNIVLAYSSKNPLIKLIKQPERSGKASAINVFLKQSSDPVVVIQSADTVATPDTIESLCKPFLMDKRIGMTGGAPIPVNNKETFVGYIVHTWWWFHRNIPRFGEIIAFRNVLERISEKTAVDEAFIQAKFAKLKYRIVHIDEAVVHNKGAEHLADIIRQRRRIFNGHSRLHESENVKIDNMTKSSLKLLLFKLKINSFRELIWLIGGVFVELISRFLGAYDQYISKINPHIWDTARSTKNLRLKTKKATS